MPKDPRHAVLRRLRERLGMNVPQVAVIFGVEPSAVYNWEHRGFPRFQRAVFELLLQCIDSLGIEKTRTIFDKCLGQDDTAMVTSLVRSIQMRE